MLRWRRGTISKISEDFIADNIPRIEALKAVAWLVLVDMDE